MKNSCFCVKFDIETFLMLFIYKLRQIIKIYTAGINIVFLVIIKLLYLSQKLWLENKMHFFTTRYDKLEISSSTNFASSTTNITRFGDIQETRPDNKTNDIRTLFVPVAAALLSHQKKGRLPT